MKNNSPNILKQISLVTPFKDANFNYNLNKENKENNGNSNFQYSYKRKKENNTSDQKFGNIIENLKQNFLPPEYIFKDCQKSNKSQDLSNNSDCPIANKQSREIMYNLNLELTNIDEIQNYCNTYSTHDNLSNISPYIQYDDSLYKQQPCIYDEYDVILIKVSDFKKIINKIEIYNDLLINQQIELKKISQKDLKMPLQVQPTNNIQNMQLQVQPINNIQNMPKSSNIEKIQKNEIKSIQQINNSKININTQPIKPIKPMSIITKPPLPAPYREVNQKKISCQYLNEKSPDNFISEINTSRSVQINDKDAQNSQIRNRSQRSLQPNQQNKQNRSIFNDLSKYASVSVEQYSSIQQYPHAQQYSSVQQYENKKKQVNQIQINLKNIERQHDQELKNKRSVSHDCSIF